MPRKARAENPRLPRIVKSISTASIGLGQLAAGIDAHVKILAIHRDAGHERVGIAAEIGLEKLGAHAAAVRVAIRDLARDSRGGPSLPSVLPDMQQTALSLVERLADRPLPVECSALAQLPLARWAHTLRSLSAGFAAQAAMLESDGSLPGMASVRKRGMTAGEANRRARALLEQDERFAGKTMRQWAAAIGCSFSLVRRLPTWRTLKRAREELHPHDRDTLRKLGSG